MRGLKLSTRAAEGTVVNTRYPGIHRQAQRLIGQYGTAVHTAYFDPEVQHFICPGIDGMVGFKSRSGIAVTMGAPLCAPADLERLNAAYRAFCKKRRMPRMYMGVTEPFLSLARGAGYGIVGTGEEQVVNPQIFTPDRGLRSSLKGAEKAGVKFSELDLQQDADLRVDLESMVKETLASRTGTQVYACEMQPFAAPTIMRWFYATQNLGQGPQPVGLLTLLQVGEGRYAIDNCVQLKTVGELKVNGNVTHALHCEMLATLKQEGENCTFVSFGLTENASPSEVSGFPAWRERLIRWGHAGFGDILHSEGKRMFRSRYTKAADPSCLVLDPPRLNLSHMLASMQAVHVSRRRTWRMLFTQAYTTLVQPQLDRFRGIFRRLSAALTLRQRAAND
jgi:hypothetical protein